MLTTQIQVLLYVGNIQLISCSVFVPVPSIVVKSHQTLEAILPYLPLSLTSLDPEENNSGPDPLLSQPALPAPPVVESHSSNTSAALSSAAHSSHSTSIVLSTRQDIIPSSSSPSSRNNSSNSNTRRSSSNSNRISPDSSIPATTCIKISLQPTPSFKFVKPKCPHQHQKNRNRRHVQQEQQQQHHPSHSHSHSHHHGHNHSHSHSHQHRSDTHRHNHNHNHNHSNNSATSMASLEYPQQTSATATATAAATAVGGTITIKFTYPVPSTDSSSLTTIPGQVQVTGTFNAWQRSQPLTCNQDRTFFEADIPIDLASLPQEADNDKKAQEENGNRRKILFKFVLDDQSWVTDPDQPTERDYAGNLNNVLFINNPLASTSATTTPATPKGEGDVKIEAKAEEEKAARLKQEAEDDETIRQLGGGMWGAPFFSVNDPIALPEHFTTADNEVSQTKEAEVASAVAVAPVAAAVASKEEEEEVESAVAAVTQEIVAKRVEVDVPAVQDTQSVTVVESLSSSLAPENPNEVKTKAKEEVEDEDDKIIKALGGGMWGTPFFKVNDPAELPEHFLEALKHNAAAATVSTLPSSSTAVATAVETETEEEEEEEEEEITTDKDGSSTGEHHSHVQIVKDEITATVEGGSLIETVVETTEDTVITAADGTFLEESITTTVEDTISGVLEEEVTEVIETIEEEEIAPSAAAAAAGQVVVEDEGVVEFVETIEEQTDDANDSRISAGVETPPEVTMTETETTTAVQGEDGVETIVVEDTMTFTDGPEVDASSLHSLTTATKPVGEGESVVVEQAPEVVIAATSASGPGDAKPSVDESVETPLPSLSSTTVNTAATPASESAEVVEPSTPVPGRVQQPLQDVVALLPQGTTTTVAGDAKPTADLSVATTVLTPLVEVKSTLPAHLAPDAAPAALTLTTVAPTTMEKGEKTEKSEKRKSFWKKIKKVLA